MVNITKWGVEKINRALKAGKIQIGMYWVNPGAISGHIMGIHGVESFDDREDLAEAAREIQSFIEG